MSCCVCRCLSEASGATDLTLMRQRVRVYEDTVGNVEEGVAVMVAIASQILRRKQLEARITTCVPLVTGSGAMPARKVSISPHVCMLRRHLSLVLTPTQRCTIFVPC